MTHLKKALFGLAIAVTLVLAGANSAKADCTSSTVVAGAANLRAEGTTELTATVALACPGAAPTVQATSSNITIVFSPTTTKATIGGGQTTVNAATVFTLNSVAQTATAGAWTNTCASAVAADNRSTFPCPALSSTSVPTGGLPVVTTSGNIVNFNFTPSAAAQTFYITGVRINVASTALPTGGAVTASIITSGGVGSKQNSSVVFGIIQSTLASTSGFANATTIALAACGPKVVTPLGTPAINTGNPDLGLLSSLKATFVEGFAGAFVKGATLDGGYPSEAAPPSPVIFPPAAGAGAFGLRIRVSITGVPSGFVVYAPEVVSAGSAAATGGVSAGAAPGATVFTLVSGAALDGSGGGPLTATVANQYDLLTPTGGAVSAIYEVTTASNGVVPETVTINVALTGTATTGVGAISGQLTLAPNGPPTVNAALPQFAAINKPGVVATVALCASYLLFPWIANTNDGNYDTGFAISNTTSDPSVIGTTGQTGDVTMYIFPSDGSAPTTQTIATGLKPGATATFVLSSLKKAVTGYAIVVCNFTLGHGFAFIDNPIAGQNGFAEGYLALSITNPRLGALTPTESAGH